MNEKQLSQHSKLLEMGRSRFIWKYGILMWGLSTAILSSIAMGFLHGFKIFPFYLLSFLMLSPLAGYCWGAIMWYWFTNQPLDQEQSPPADIEST